MDGHGTSPVGRCEGIPDPSEVSSLGKLNVFLISYNLITLNDINTNLEMPSFNNFGLNKMKFGHKIVKGLDFSKLEDLKDNPG